MSVKPYFIGIDVSTTATKALVINAKGEVLAVSTSEYPFDTPRPLWSEQDPALWWQGTISSLQSVLAKAGITGTDVAAVGLTGQMHGLVLMDQEGNVLRPSILWNDQRTAAQCDQIRNIVGKERFISITGNDALTGFTAPKILWVRENEPAVFEKARHILLPKDYVRFRLTGEYAMDKADGAGTILMDLKTRDWSPEILTKLEIPQDWLPPLFEGPEITGHITPDAAALTGLRPGTPVVAGGGDQAAQALGVGAVREGIVALTLGTSGVVFASVDHPFIEPQGRLHAFCHSAPGRWHLMGVMLSAAGSLRWYRDTFSPETSFDSLVEEATDVNPGADGLIYLPYLTGERTPYPDPLARGAFVGATIRSTRAHFTRAVLEGVAFGLRDSFDLMKSSGLSRIEQVRVSGGGAKSLLWRQILADVFQAELVTINTAEGAAYGAALLAGTGAGCWSTVDEACSEAIRITGRVAPSQNSARYEPWVKRYRSLYPALTPYFHELGE